MQNIFNAHILTQAYLVNPFALIVSHWRMQLATLATCGADESINYLSTENACIGWLTFRQSVNGYTYLFLEHCWAVSGVTVVAQHEAYILLNAT